MFKILCKNFDNCAPKEHIKFSKEYWSGLSLPSPGDLPDPGIEPRSPALAGRFFITEPPGKPICNYSIVQ